MLQIVPARLLMGICLFFGLQEGNYQDQEKPAKVIEMTNSSRFVPGKVTISKGDVVLWKNTSDLVHTVTCDPEKAVKAEHVSLPAGADPFNSGKMEPGAEFSVKFTVTGTYKYFCVLHEMIGMTGTIIVEK